MMIRQAALHWALILCQLLPFTRTASGRCTQLSSHITDQETEANLSRANRWQNSDLTRISCTKAQAAKLLQLYQADTKIVSILWKDKLTLGDIWWFFTCEQIQFCYQILSLRTGSRAFCTLLVFMLIFKKWSHFLLRSLSTSLLDRAKSSLQCLLEAQQQFRVFHRVAACLEDCLSPHPDHTICWGLHSPPLPPPCSPEPNMGPGIEQTPHRRWWRGHPTGSHYDPVCMS